MIYFRLIEERPHDLDEKGEAAWSQTFRAWRIEHSEEGPLAYLGLVPLDFFNKRGYWWMQPLTLTPTRAALREAKQAFALFDHALGWTTYAHTEARKKKNGRFARFFGFRYLGEVRGQEYYER